MNCPDCGEKMSRDNTKVYAWHCPKCNDDYKDDYVMGYWKGYADAKYAAQHNAHLTGGESAAKAGFLTPEEDAAIKADNQPTHPQVA